MSRLTYVLDVTQHRTRWSNNLAAAPGCFRDHDELRKELDKVKEKPTRHRRHRTVQRAYLTEHIVRISYW